MEKSAEDLTEKTTIFYLRHPCYFFEEAFRALFSCLGLEIGTTRDCRKQMLQVDDSSSDVEQYSSSSQTTDKENSTRIEETASNNQKSSQQEDVDAPSTALEQQLIGMNRRGPSRSVIGSGQGPQIN